MSEESSTTESLTTAEIDALGKLAAEASEGPWRACGAPGCTCGLVWHASGEYPIAICGYSEMGVKARREDMSFIAAARRGVPRLIATIAERDKALDDATVMLDVSNRQLAEIRSMVGDGPAAEAVRRALAEKDAEVDRCNRMMDHYRATIRESLELVSACDGEPLPDAISRGLRELFELTRTEMEKMATFAVDSIEENMRVGAKGMRDACAQIAGALSTSPNAFVAATSTGIRKAIEALPLP